MPQNCLRCDSNREQHYLSKDFKQNVFNITSMRNSNYYRTILSKLCYA